MNLEQRPPATSSTVERTTSCGPEEAYSSQERGRPVTGHITPSPLPPSLPLLFPPSLSPSLPLLFPPSLPGSLASFQTGSELQQQLAATGSVPHQSSLLTPHLLPLTPHPSPLTQHSSLLTPHFLSLTPHPSPNTPHLSLPTPHPSPNTHLPSSTLYDLSQTLTRWLHIWSAIEAVSLGERPTEQ